LDVTPATIERTSGAVTFHAFQIGTKALQRENLQTEFLEVEVEMPDILAARAWMGMSLACHIVFACAGVAMPLLMVIAEWLHLNTGDLVSFSRLAFRRYKRCFGVRMWRRIFGGPAIHVSNNLISVTPLGSRKSHAARWRGQWYAGCS
jgi:hypothetical protein